MSEFALYWLTGAKVVGGLIGFLTLCGWLFDTTAGNITLVVLLLILIPYGCGGLLHGR